MAQKARIYMKIRVGFELRRHKTLYAHILKKLVGVFELCL